MMQVRYLSKHPVRLSKDRLRAFSCGTCGATLW